MHPVYQRSRYEKPIIILIPAVILLGALTIIFLAITFLPQMINAKRTPY